MKKIGTLIFSIISVIYLELVFTISIFNQVTSNIIYIILFSIPVGIILYLSSGIFKKAKLNKFIYFILFFVLIILFGAQFVYYQFYESLLSFLSMTTGGQVFQWWTDILNVILRNWIVMVLIFLPLIILIIGNITKAFNYESFKGKTKILLVILFGLFQALPIILLNNINTKDMYSNKNLYYNVHAPLNTANNLGMLTAFRLDFQRWAFGFEDKSIIDNTKKEPVIEKKIEYNVTEIDFDKIIANETDKNVKAIHQYISSSTPTEKNEYTGMFKGKNLVVFVAEAFSNLAINETVTPTLYKLYNEGFQFDNFYTPIFPVSTADGEYITDTSLIPKEGVWSLKKLNGNYMPYSYANIFEGLGYTSQAYHDHTYNYYDRDKYIKTMGYDTYKACKKGLKINCNIWPESDLEMIEATTADYINDEHFLAYYMTVSGHLNYTKTGNVIVRRNWDTVKNLPYSEKAKGYLSANVELDKAISALITRLESAGKLDDTVIMISGDHYPYGLSLKEINEISAYKRDKEFEKNHSAFLVWNSTMKEPIKVEKIGSSLDILPTILNLFGIDYDSRLLIGNDILSNVNPLVIFSNRSFITDKGRYSTISKTFTPIDNLDETFDQDAYIKEISTDIYNKYKISKLILETNYYKKLKTSIDKVKQTEASEIEQKESLSNS